LNGELVRIKEKSPDRVDFPEGVAPAIGGLRAGSFVLRQATVEFKRKQYVIEVT
jgi:23S rRNA (uracil1939-C5)-methyltransferase